LSSRRWTFDLFCTQRLVSASAVIPPRTSLIRATALPCEAVGLEVCLRVGTESTNNHITQRDLPASLTPLLFSYALLHPPSNANNPVRQWYQPAQVAAGPRELPTSYQLSTPPIQTSPQHSPSPNTPSRQRHQYHHSSSRAFGNCLLLANRQWIPDNHIIITIRPTPSDRHHPTDTIRHPRRRPRLRPGLQPTTE
jgi:hypothetical protein